MFITVSLLDTNKYVARKGSLSNGASKQWDTLQLGRKHGEVSVPNVVLDNVAPLVYSFFF